MWRKDYLRTTEESLSVLKDCLVVKVKALRVLSCPWDKNRPNINRSIRRVWVVSMFASFLGKTILQSIIIAEVQLQEVLKEWTPSNEPQLSQ